MPMFRRLAKDERGATAVEYGLILALVFLAMIGAVQTFASGTIEMWADVSAEVRGAGGGGESGRTK